jgi:hypothetical protein
MKEQLQRVMEHARITLWAADRQNKLVLFEGDMGCKDARANNVVMMYKNLDEVFGEIQGPELDCWNQAVKKAFRGNPHDELIERVLMTHDRCYRTRLAPLWEMSESKGTLDDACVEGFVEGSWVCQWMSRNCKRGRSN